MLVPLLPFLHTSLSLRALTARSFKTRQLLQSQAVFSPSPPPSPPPLLSGFSDTYRFLVFGGGGFCFFVFFFVFFGFLQASFWPSGAAPFLKARSGPEDPESWLLVGFSFMFVFSFLAFCETVSFLCETGSCFALTRLAAGSFFLPSSPVFFSIGICPNRSATRATLGIAFVFFAVPSSLVSVDVGGSCRPPHQHCSLRLPQSFRSPLKCLAPFGLRVLSSSFFLWVCHPCWYLIFPLFFFSSIQPFLSRRGKPPLRNQTLHQVCWCSFEPGTQQIFK